MGKTNAFRSKQTQTAPAEPVVYKEDVPVTSDIDTEPPFTSYREIKHQPFLVDHYKLGDAWKDKLGGFTEEVDFIEGYFKDKIEQGEMKNETKAVKDEIGKIYKLNKIDKNERTTMQIEKLAAYIKFLKETDKIEMLRYKYR